MSFSSAREITIGGHVVIVHDHILPGMTNCPVPVMTQQEADEVIRHMYNPSYPYHVDSLACGYFDVMYTNGIKPKSVDILIDKIYHITNQYLKWRKSCGRHGTSMIQTGIYSYEKPVIFMSRDGLKDLMDHLRIIFNNKGLDFDQLLFE